MAVDFSSRMLDRAEANIRKMALNNVDLHEMDAEARRFAMLRLGERFEQLRAVSMHVRRVIARTSYFYKTLDLSDTLDSINAAVVELTDASQVRSCQVQLKAACPFGLRAL